MLGMFHDTVQKKKPSKISFITSREAELTEPGFVQEHGLFGIHPLEDAYRMVSHRNQNNTKIDSTIPYTHQALKASNRSRSRLHTPFGNSKRNPKSANIVSLSSNLPLIFTTL